MSLGFFGGQKLFQRQVRTWIYPQIANVEFNTGLPAGYLEIQPSGGTMTTKQDRADNMIRFSKLGGRVEHFQWLHQLIQQQIVRAHTPQQQAAAEPDALTQLQKLPELREQGSFRKKSFKRRRAAF